MARAAAEGSTNPRAEIIVRQRQQPPPNDWFGGEAESGLPQRSCLTTEPIGLTFRTGLGGTRRCHCAPSDHLNCDAGAG